ncbi:MAG: CpXC domain-containing protein [Kofleriaceae bacterium]
MITGKVEVRCPVCGTPQDAELVQSLNRREQPAAVQRLLAGELNVLQCIACSRRTPLAATMVFHDPDHAFYCQVVPGELAKAIAAFRESGATGSQRIVRTQNALIEKIKILDAGLVDWAVELVKLEVDAGPLLFDRADAELHWIKVERIVTGIASPRAAYDAIATREPPTDYVIDRAWALASLPN